LAFGWPPLNISAPSETVEARLPDPTVEAKLLDPTVEARLLDPTATVEAKKTPLTLFES